MKTPVGKTGRDLEKAKGKIYSAFSIPKNTFVIQIAD